MDRRSSFALLAATAVIFASLASEARPMGKRLAGKRPAKPRKTKAATTSPRDSSVPPTGRFCSGAYASSFSVISAQVRRREASARYTFCLRSKAVYQCPYYAADGRLRTRQKTVTRHGTAFAFRKKRGKTYLATNEHVSEWPLVTAAKGSVDGVPAGCRRIKQTLTLVDKESDAYARDDIALSRVLADAELDVAVLRGKVSVPDIPFRLGQSAALSVRDAVQVRGFPLGAFQATSVGKVINPRARDEEQGWDHTDMVIDAQLSSGNSGSPVLAVSCKTGQLELVGIYHAAYKEGQGLNVAVGVDEFRQILTTLKPRPKRKRRKKLSLVDRRWLLVQLGRGAVPWLPFGGHTVHIRLHPVHKARIYYDVFAKGFPLSGRRLATIEDLPAVYYGRIGRLWLSGGDKQHEISLPMLPAVDQARVLELLTALRRRSQLVLRYRRLLPVSRRTRLAHDRLKALKRRLDSGDSARQSQMKALGVLAGRAERLARAVARRKRLARLARLAALARANKDAWPAASRPASRPASSRPAASSQPASRAATSRPVSRPAAASRTSVKAAPRKSQLGAAPGGAAPRRAPTSQPRRRVTKPQPTSIPKTP